MQQLIKKGVFVTLEGIEGAGKTSMVTVVAEALREADIDFICTREPGGTEIAESIRRVLLTHYQETVLPETEALLYFAGRIQHLKTIIIPALERGSWVICDRFTDATYAYQSGGREVDFGKIAMLEKLVLENFKPDYTILLDVPAKVGIARIKKRLSLDRIEEEDELFFKRTRATYLQLAKNESGRFLVVDAAKELVEVAQQVTKITKQIISKYLVTNH